MSNTDAAQTTENQPAENQMSNTDAVQTIWDQAEAAATILPALESQVKEASFIIRILTDACILG
jgi:hypothetical protein